MSRALVVILLLAGSLAGAGSAESSGPPAGVIVEGVGAGSLGERAGLKPGDVLVSWQLQPSFPANPFPAAGWLTTPFDLLEALIERAPRGRLTLSGTRAGEPRAWTLTEGTSVERAAIVARPPLDGEALALYEKGVRDLERKEVDAGLEAWHGAAAAAFAEHDSLAGLWLRYRSAEIRLERMHAGWERAPAEVAPLLRSAGQDIAAAELYTFSGFHWTTKEDGPRAEADWEEASALLARRSRWSLVRARVEAGWARALAVQERFDLSRRHQSEALAVRAALAPWSLDLAESSMGLGELGSYQGEFAGAVQPYSDSELVLRRLDPGSLRHVRRMLALGDTLYNLGRVREAESLILEARGYGLAVAPARVETASLYLYLSYFAAGRAEVRKAEGYLRQSLAILGRLPPTELVKRRRARALSALASALLAAGDMEAAEYQGRLALEAEREASRRDRLDNRAGDTLAAILLDLGRYDEARSLLTDALAGKPPGTGNGRNRARTLRLLGELELRAGKDLPAAGRALREARELYESTGLTSVSLAYVVRLQGELEGALGHPDRALALLEPLLARRRELSPGGGEDAHLQHLIGQQHRAAGRRAEAARYLCDAVRTLDRLGDLVGRSAEDPFFAARSGFYAECIEALMEEGTNEGAFQILESGRARGLLEMMAFRDLSTQELSAENRAGRSRLRERYEALYGELAARPDSDRGPDLATHLELTTLQREIDALADRVRRESPRFASLHYPLPLGLAEARQALDPGTALLAYSVGDRQSFLFVVTAAGAPGTGLKVYRLAASSARIGREIRALTALLRNPRSSLERVRSQAGDLYRLLVAPAAAEVAAADRILLALDGPLHGLPFAALVASDGRYLVEAKPLHTTISATVYAEIKKERRAKVPEEEVRFAAFGDPIYPAVAGAPPSGGEETLAGQTLRGISLAPLPGTRREVEAIGALYPNSQVFVGGDATEERLKALGRAPNGPRILHFAGHAVLDQRMPINSFLAFSLPQQPAPGRENGLLQAWEIFEDVRLDADLVTLSACNTALGKEMGGEGLVGLTRAFQFAGARSVLASLWAIGDGATARFMPRFYEHLRSGLTKDEALRLTQIEWIRDPKRSHPSHWAAFELIGDYK